MTATPFDLPLTDVRQPTLAVAAGRNLIAAGAIFGLANLSEWAILGGIVPVHPAALSLIWPVAVVGFILILRRLRRHGGDSVRRAVAWSRLAIFSQIGIALALAAVSAIRQDWSLMMWTSPVGLVLYGVAWLTASLRGGRPWMAAVGIAATVAAGGVALLVGTPVQYLAYAGGLFAFALLPGLALVLQPTR